MTLIQFTEPLKKSAEGFFEKYHIHRRTVGMSSRSVPIADHRRYFVYRRPVEGIKFVEDLYKVFCL